MQISFINVSSILMKIPMTTRSNLEVSNQERAHRNSGLHKEKQELRQRIDLNGYQK